MNFSCLSWILNVHWGFLQCFTFGNMCCFSSFCSLKKTESNTVILIFTLTFISLPTLRNMCMSFVNIHPPLRFRPACNSFWLKKSWHSVLLWCHSFSHHLLDFTEGTKWVSVVILPNSSCKPVLSCALLSLLILYWKQASSLPVPTSFPTMS